MGYYCQESTCKSDTISLVDTCEVDEKLSTCRSSFSGGKYTTEHNRINMQLCAALITHCLVNESINLIMHNWTVTLLDVP